MQTTALPSVFPAEGTYEVSTIHVDLACATGNAKIYYTTDGTEPTVDSAIYDRTAGLIPLRHCPGQDTIEIRAFAQAEGCTPSRIVCFTYRFACWQKGTFRHQMLREPSSKAAGIIRILDFDLDKMYLVIGQERAVLVDAGWDETGDLPGLCRELAGDRPVDLIVAHGHPDHIAQTDRFLQAGCKVYIPYADEQIARGFGWETPFCQYHDLTGGMTFDLGGTTLQTYHIPGHTPGSVVLVDRETGDLFASDSFGSNRRYIPDSAWLQLSGYSLETCLRSLETFIQQVGEKCQRIFTGHNDEILNANDYLSTLRAALQKAVVSGNAALVPSLRSAAESFGSGTMTVEGDWRLDPVWAAANVQFIYDKDRDHQPPHYAYGFDPDIQTEL